MTRFYEWLRNPQGWWVFWISSGISILISCWFDPYGGITLDGPWYLKLAQSIADGNGMNVLSPDYIFYTKLHYVHLWPPLYPFLIAIFSFGNSIPVWWSFRLVNWLITGLVLKTIWKFETPNRMAFAALLLSGYWIDMQYQCWSEWPAICLIMLFFLVCKYKSEKWWLHFLIMSLLWLTRYQLALVPAIYMLNAIYHRNRKQYISGFVNLSLAGIFIWLNYISHNRIWTDAGISFKEIAVTAGLQFLKQLNFLFCHHIHSYKLIPVSILALYLLSKNIAWSRKLWVNIPVMIGIVYLGMALILRSGFAVGIAHDRFYTFFLTCIIAGILLELPFTPQKWLPAYVVLSLFINTGIKNYYINQVQGHETSAERISRLTKFYQPIPSGSILVFADKWTEFLRPDIFSISPYERVMGSLSWKPERFFSLMQKQGKPVYIEIISTNDPRINRYDPVYKAWMKAHQGKTFIQLH